MKTDEEKIKTIKDLILEIKNSPKLMKELDCWIEAPEVWRNTTMEHKEKLKKSKYDLIRYYDRKINSLQKRIDYLESEEFYNAIKSFVLKQNEK